MQVEVTFLAPKEMKLKKNKPKLLADLMEKLAEDWKKRGKEKSIAKSVEILREKFTSVDGFGPQQLVEFHAAPDPETQAMHARRAYELA